MRFSLSFERNKTENWTRHFIYQALLRTVPLGRTVLVWKTIVFETVLLLYFIFQPFKTFFLSALLLLSTPCLYSFPVKNGCAPDLVVGNYGSLTRQSPGTQNVACDVSICTAIVEKQFIVYFIYLFVCLFFRWYVLMQDFRQTDLKWFWYDF